MSALAAALLCCAAVPAGAASSAVVPAPSERAVVAALSAALATKSLPSTVTPTLQQLQSDPYQQEGTITYVKKSCDPYTYPSEASNPQPCWFGATARTDPVIVIFGDSFVGNWMPALAYAGKVLGYRVADFEFKGCFTSFTPSSTEPGFGPNLVAACNTWHTTLPPAVLRLHPRVLVAANGTPAWRVSQAAWLSGMQLAFHKLNPRGSSTEILLGTGIHLPTPAPQCLASSPSNIQACTFRYSPSSDTQSAFTRDALTAASVKHLHLIPTYPWVCRSGACPLVVDHVIVYADWDHVTIAYSDYLSHVFLAALRSALRPVPAAPRTT